MKGERRGLTGLGRGSSRSDVVVVECLRERLACSFCLVQTAQVAMIIFAFILLCLLTDFPDRTHTLDLATRLFLALSTCWQHVIVCCCSR